MVSQRWCFRQLCSIEIDGRQLIDGPADNSQVWSEQVTDTANLDGPVSALFDGDLSNGIKTVNPLNGNAYIDGLSIPVTTTLSIYSPDGSADIDINDGAATATGSDWIDIPFTGTLNKLSWTHSGSTVGLNLFGLKADGVTLIDACPVWNTSQVWSDGQNVEARPEKASDGNTQTSYSSSADADNNSTVIGQGNEYALDNVGAVANKIEVLARGWLNSGKEELADIYVGANKLGTTPTQGSNTQAIWSSFDFTGTIDAANSLRIVDVSTGDYAQRLIAIRIDGEILVDGGSFGANGFHLPFDPAATGVNYSGKLSIVAPSANGPVKAFDGDLTTQCDTGWEAHLRLISQGLVSLANVRCMPW